jgi:hypothetical protein
MDKAAPRAAPHGQQVASSTAQSGLGSQNVIRFFIVLMTGGFKVPRRSAAWGIASRMPDPECKAGRGTGTLRPWMLRTIEAVGRWTRPGRQEHREIPRTTKQPTPQQ